MQKILKPTATSERAAKRRLAILSVMAGCSLQPFGRMIVLILLSSSTVCGDELQPAKGASERARSGTSETNRVGPEIEKPLTPAATQFIKGMTLVLLPETYSDEDDWGGTKRIQSGLNVKLDGLRLDTSRRWKNVNHGTWQRVDAELVDPEQQFDLSISLLPRIDPAVPRYRVRTKIRLRATGRQQQWSLGAKLYSLSADFVTDVSLDCVMHFKNDIIRKEDGGKIRVIPHIESARAQLESFSLRRVSHVKGSGVREFGKVVESIIKRAIKKKNHKLAAKINGKINKKPERFEIPVGMLVFFKAGQSK